MQLFKRGKKPDQDVNPSKDGSAPSTDPGAKDEGEPEKNEINLARTKTEDIVYPTGLKLGLLMTSVFISSTFLPADFRTHSGLTVAKQM